MRLVELKITNYRAYAQETTIELDPLTLFVGKNDAGKSSILEALDIFLNEANIERGDCCVRTGSTDIHIACVFDELPDQLVIDEQHPTSLQEEYLLRGDGKLEIRKTFNCAAAKGKLASVVARAQHPSAAGVGDLIELRIAELRTRAQQKQVDLANVNQTIKAELRKAIWAQAANLNLAERDVGLQKESGKEVWEQLQKHMPVYALFRSDRASTDQDAEAQDPLRMAVKEAIRRRAGQLEGVIEEIKQELEHVANRTVAKIREMSPGLADELRPEIKNKNWDSLFTISLTGDEDIPINKRGSGTRRLVLLNFFRAKAEDDSNARGCGVIYGVEEPETSQHPNHQIALLEAFEELVEQGRCQVLITTHTPTLARRVSRGALRLVTQVEKVPQIEHGKLDATLEKVKKTLGVLPDHDVKVFLGVEGKHDISFLKRISATLAAVEPDIPDLARAENAGLLVFVPLAGSNMDVWVNTLAGLNRPEFYLTDRDQAAPALPKYQQQLLDWRARGCTAWATSKRELENYLHVQVIAQIAPGYSGIGADFEDVPMLFAESVHAAAAGAPPWATLDRDQKKDKASRAKKRLNTECVELMTPALLTLSDPQHEIRGWLRTIGVELIA